MNDHSTTDPLAASAAGIIAHMNEDHADALAVYAEVRGGVRLTAPTMTRVAREGFEITGRDTAGEPHTIWIPFPEPCGSPGDVRKHLVQMVRADREALAARGD